MSWDKEPPRQNELSQSPSEGSWDSEPPPAELKAEKRDAILGIPITTIEGALDALPMAGAIAGGTFGAFAGSPTGPGAIGTSVVGAGLGGAGGQTLANMIRTGLDLDSAPQTRAQHYTGVAKEGLLGAAGEGAGQVIAKIPAAVRAAPGAVRQASKAVGRWVSDAPVVDDALSAARFEDVGFQAKPRPNALEIKAATKRIGGEATPGMLSANQNVQNLENVLSQSPTISGERVRKAYDPIRKGLTESAEGLAGRPAVSPVEAGTQFKVGLQQKIAEKVKPLSSRFEEIRTAAKHVRPEAASLNKAADRLLKQDLAEFANLPQGQAINKYADMIRSAKSLDSLKQLRSSVGDEMGKALDAGDGQLAMALGKVKGSIQRLERREILKSAIAATPSKKEGTLAAKDLINEIKGVNKGWRSLMTELEAVAKAGGIKKIASPKHLSRIIDDMPAEKITERFFNTKNYQGLRDIKTHLPEEFEILRQNRLGVIAEKSLTKGEPDPVKLVRNLKAIGKESRELLFGKDGERVLRDMETVLNSMPSKVGTSDTPRGMAWFNLLKPSHYAQEAQSAYNYIKLSGQTVQKSQNQGKAGLVPRALGYAGVGAASSEMERGEQKWARAGIAKINAHAGLSVFDSNFDLKTADPKVKNLLIRASDLKPGSPAMENIMKEINSKFGGK